MSRKKYRCLVGRLPVMLAGNEVTGGVPDIVAVPEIGRIFLHTLAKQNSSTTPSLNLSNSTTSKSLPLHALETHHSHSFGHYQFNRYPLLSPCTYSNRPSFRLPPLLHTPVYLPCPPRSAARTPSIIAQDSNRIAHALPPPPASISPPFATNARRSSLSA